MAKLQKLIEVLGSSGDEDLIRSAENLQQLIDTGFPEHKALLDKHQSFIVKVKIDTDWDFEINGAYDLEMEFQDVSRDAAVQKMVDFLLNADYRLEEMPYYSENVEYFKREYVLQTAEHLKSHEYMSRGGNWSYDVNVISPETSKPDYIAPVAKITLGGVDYEI